MTLESFSAEVSQISKRLLLRPYDEVFDALKAASIRNRCEPNAVLIPEWADQISRGIEVNPKVE
jgi:hypothetical protein